MANDQHMIDAIKEAITDALSKTNDVDLLDFVLKLLICESRQ